MFVDGAGANGATHSDCGLLRSHARAHLRHGLPGAAAASPHGGLNNGGFNQPNRSKIYSLTHAHSS
eukprot:1194630-Prorocentrum_minimum.AAC.2